MIQRESVWLDSQIVSYLVQAMEPDYDPEQDTNAKLKPERVAAFRIFLHSPALFISPTVNSEIKKIPELKRCKSAHDQLIGHHLEEPQISDGGILEARVSELMKFHCKPLDCRILAEAERGEATRLLSFDAGFLKHMQKARSPVKLLKPSVHWKAMDIPRGTKPLWTPHDSNPHHGKTWWNW